MSPYVAGFDSDSILLVTGASGGIGSQLLVQARAAGLRCVAVSRRPLNAAAAELVVQADVSRPEGAAAALQAARAAFGRAPDLLCHAAGSVRLAALERVSEDDWQTILRANLDSAFYTLQAWSRALGSQPGAALFFSSAAAAVGTPSHSAIAAAKAGIEGLVRAAAAELAVRGARINALSLAMIETPMTAMFLGSERSRQSVAAQYPLGRHGQPAEAAAQALWLLSRSCAWMTGQILRLDGGFSTIRPLVRA